MQGAFVIDVAISEILDLLKGVRTTAATSFAAA
jgi:hypothetical protein